MAYSEEIKAQVHAALLAGGSPSEIARKFSMPRQTVLRFKAELSEDALKEASIETRHRIDDLLLDCMAENLSALSRIAQTTHDADYLKKQGAEACATLYGQIASTTVRLLEAASAAGVGEVGEPANE